MPSSHSAGYLLCALELPGVGIPLDALGVGIPVGRPILLGILSPDGLCAILMSTYYYSTAHWCP